MAHAAQFNMNANVGADFERKFKLKDGTGNTDITNYTFTAKAKQHHTKTTGSVSLENKPFIADAAPLAATLILPKNPTDFFPP